MTSTNDGKEVKNNQTSSTKGKTYLIELYKSLDARLSETGEASERTKHLCIAWRSVHSLCQHSAPNTQTHLLNWLPRHTARTVLQTSWQKPERDDDRRSLEAAINDFIATAHSSSTNGTASWEVELVSRGEWFKRLLESPWDHPVLTSLLNATGSPPTDDEVLTWLKEERGVTFVVRLHTLVGEKCDDIAVSLATAVMDRVRTALLPLDDAQEQVAPPVDSGPTFGDKLKDEAGFTTDVWDAITDIEFVLLHKRDRQQCIALAKQTALPDAYPLIERLQKRLEAAPHEKRLWKNARVVAILIAQVVIARCMVLKVCEGAPRKALYCCSRLLARLLTSELPKVADALAAQALTARHLHTIAFAVDNELLPAHEAMRPYVCELYVRALTAGMNELERLKVKTENETEARTMERTLASWFVQLGTVLNKSCRIACECTLTAFSLQPSQHMYQHIEAAPPLAAVLTDSNDTKEEPISSELGSWANDSRSQTNLVKTSETLKLKHSQNQANVLSTAIFNEGEALGLSQMLCQDIAVLLAGPRVKTLSWDMDRSLLLEKCRAYMEQTHGGTRVLTRELKYLNIDLKQYQHLPEEQDDDENDPYYGIERGYEHLAVLEEPEDIFTEMNPDESASGIDEDYLLPRRKKKTKRIKTESNSEDDSGPLSEVAEAKRTQKKKERPHSKERSKERAKKKQEPVDPLAPDSEKKEKPPKEKKEKPPKERKEKPPKEKKERKKKEKAPKVISGKRTSLAKLLGFKVGNTKKRHKDVTPVTRPVSPGAATDSDYDTQGKHSLTSFNSEGTEHDSMEASWRAMYEATEKNRPSTTTITTNKPKHYQRPPNLSKMQYRPQNPNAPKPGMSSNFPSTQSGRTFDISKQHPDAVRANLSRIVEYRLQKEMEKNMEAQTARTSAIQRPNIPPLQTNISPKAVVIPEIPKSYISKEQAERYAEIVRNQRNTDSVNEYARNLATSKSLPLGTDSRSKIQQPNANTLKMADIVNTSYDRLMAEIAERHSKSREAKPPQTQYQPPPSPMPTQRPSYMTAGQRDFQHFLQNYERKSVMPHPADMTLKSKKPRPVSRIVPVIPNVPKIETKPVQSAKPPIQQKKPEATLNTFSRLSYMHKNKQNEIKKAPAQTTCDTSSYQDVSTELDEIIKEHQQAQRRVIQAKRDRETFLKSQETDSKTNPLLSNLLSDTYNDLNNRREAQYKSNQVPQNLSSKSILQPGAPTKSNSVPLATINSALSEKDQNDLWNLLRQQNKMNNTSHYSTSIHSKPSTSTASNSQLMTQYNTIGHNQQQPYHPSKTPDLEGKYIKSSIENKIINVLSDKFLKPGCHEVNKSLSVNIKPQTASKTSEKLCTPIRKQDKVNKSSPSKATAKSETPEWQSVMQDIIKLKTPSRESSIIELPPRQRSYESVFEKSLKKPSLLSTQTKIENDMPLKHQDRVDRLKPVITSIQNVIITKEGIKLQDAPHPQKDGPETSKHYLPKPKPTFAEGNKSKKATNDPSKRVPQETQGKQFTYSGPKHIDPFISGIPNSDYDLLEELMDDDLRKEIGELSSDEDSYNSAAQSFLKASKSNEKQRVSIQYNKCVNDASPPKPATVVGCLNVSSSETPLVIVKPVSQCANKMSVTHGNSPSQKKFTVESILASQNSTRQIPSSTSTENQVYAGQNTKTPVLMNPNSIYISAVPQQAPVQNVVLVGSEFLYGGYSTVQTPVQQPVASYASNYVAVNNLPITLYQTQYTAPVVIGASVSVSVINKVSSSTASDVLNVQSTSTHIDGLSSCTQVNLSVDDCHQQNYKSQEEIKQNERKVLSEVQDFATTEKADNSQNQMMENNISETVNKETADNERLKKKRLAILNREIYHRCGEKTIPLSYSPLQKIEAVLNHDISKVIRVSKDDNLSKNFPDTDDEKLLAQIKSNLQDLSDAINEVSSPATPDSTESKENKNIPTGTGRRILLRSSNIMTPKTAVKLETPTTKKSRAKSKADVTEPRIKTETRVKEPPNSNAAEKLKDVPAKTKKKSKPKSDEIEKTHLTPSRVSKRVRNKKIAKPAKETTEPQNEPAKITTKNKLLLNKGTNKAQDETSIEYDIESELQGSVITKLTPAMKVTAILKENDNIPMASLTDGNCSNVENDEDKTVNEDLQKSLDDTQVDEECAHLVTKPGKQNNYIEIVSKMSVAPTIEAIDTKNLIKESKTEVQNVSVSSELTTDIESDNKPVCQQTTDVRINYKVQQMEESLNENIIGVITNENCQQQNIDKNTNQNMSEILEATSGDTRIYGSVNDLSVKANPEDSISTLKLSTVEEIKEITELSKNTYTNENETTDDVNIILKKTTIETENRSTLLQKEDIDLDMSVTCDEIISTPSPILGTVITARSKSINSEQKKDSKVIETSSTADIRQIKKVGNVCEDIVSSNDKEETSKIKIDDKSVAANFTNSETSGKASSPYIENMIVEPTPENRLIPEVVTSETSAKNQEKTFDTYTSASDDDDVVLLDDDITSEVKVRPINRENMNIVRNSNKSALPNVMLVPNVVKDNSEKVSEVNGTVHTSVTRNNKSPGNLLLGAKNHEAQKDNSSGTTSAPVTIQELPQDFKDKICIEELPCNERCKKKIRVSLPNGRKFKATVHGHLNVTYESLFTFPSIRDALLHGLNCKKLVATVDLQNPEKILSAKVLQTSTGIQNAQLIDTIDLLSDEEDNQTTNQPNTFESKEFVYETEFGKLKIKDKDLFMKHSAQLKQKSQILLQRVDKKPKVLEKVQDVDSSSLTHVVSQCDMVPIISKKTDDTPAQALEIIPKIEISGLQPLIPVQTDIIATIPNQYVTGLINDIQNDILTAKTSKIIPDVVEIDDSSNDSVDIDKKPGYKTIDLLKNSLLQELEVQFISKPIINSVHKELSEDDDVKIIDEPELEVVKESSTPAKKPSRRKAVKLSTLPTGYSCRFSDLDAEEQQEFKRRKCAIKLIRCDVLAKIHEEEIDKAEKTLTNMAEDEPVVIAEEFSLLNPFDDDITDDRSSSPVIELYEVLAALDTTLPHVDKSEEITPLSCPATWFSTKVELHNQCMNDATMEETVKQDKDIRKNCVMPLSCEANWLCTKFTTHTLVIRDISMNETTQMACENAKCTLQDQKLDVRLSLPEFEDEMCDQNTVEKIMPITCEASWMTVKSKLNLEQKYEIRSTQSLALQDNDKEMDELISVETIPLNCEANYLATKPMLYSQRIVKLILSDAYKCCDDQTSEDLMSLTCKANWHNTKPMLNLQTIELIQHHCNILDHSEHVIPPSCNAYWFESKAELQRIDIIMSRDEAETLKKTYNEITSRTPLSCEADWFATKPTTHLEASVAKSKYLANSTLQIQTNCVSSLTSNTLKILQDANVINQYTLLQKLITQNNAMTLKRRLPSVKKPVLCKLRKLNNATSDLILIDCHSITLDTTVIDVTNVSESILDNMAVNIDEDVSPNEVKMSLESLESNTTGDKDGEENANVSNSHTQINNSLCENHEDLQDSSPEISNDATLDCDKEIYASSPVSKLQDERYKIESRSPSPILNTKDLIAFENYIPSSAKNQPAQAPEISTEVTCVEDDKLQSVKTNNCNYSSSSITDTEISVFSDPNTENDKRADSFERLGSNYDDIEANLANIFGESLIADKNEDNISGDVEAYRQSVISEKFEIQKPEDERNEDQGTHTDNESADIEVYLEEETVDEVVKDDGKILENDDVIEVEVIDDWETEIIETNLENQNANKNTGNQYAFNRSEEKFTCFENNEICIEESIAKIDHMYFTSFVKGMQPMYENKEDHVVFYVPTESIVGIVSSDNESIEDLEEEIVDMQSDEIVENFVITNAANQSSKIASKISDKEPEEDPVEKTSQVKDSNSEDSKTEIENKSNINKTDTCLPNKYETSTRITHDDIEERLAQIFGEPVMNGDLNENSKNSSYEEIPSPLSDGEDVASQLSNVKKKRKNECDESTYGIDTEDMTVKVPNHTYAKCPSPVITPQRNLKRKIDMSDTRTREKKYRKAKNIDYPKFTVGSFTKTVYTKEFKSVIDYSSSLKFSFTVPFHKDVIDTHAQLQSWPISDIYTKTIENQVEGNEELFTELEKPKAILDPLTQTLEEEINSEFDENSYTPSNVDTNFSMGFGERSGRVIQESIDGEHTIFSAATLSDVKQLQPLLPSDVKETRVQSTFVDTIQDQKLKAKRFVDHLNLREKVRAFFEKSKAEFNLEFKQNLKKKNNFDNDGDASDWPFGDLTSTRSFMPSPVDITVNVVQVGQLPVSAAAQNPVTCDPRVTHVSNASPSQCSPENSIGDELQTPIKTEYTELTTADITLPMMQEYVTQHHSMPSDSQEPTIAFGANNSMNMPSDIKSVVKIELMEETSEDHEDDNMNYESSGAQQLPNGNIGNNIQYQFENPTNNVMVESSFNNQPAPNSSTMSKTAETFSENKQTCDTAEKSDQLAHAMNAAGIPANKALAKPSNTDTLPQNPQPNVTISQANTNNFPKTTPINAIALQQALAQILPPSLTHGNSSDNNTQASANPQVLHIVQGSNSHSVINKPNGTQLLHIVQNKNTGNSNVAPAPQQNTFSGLSLVDGTLQQGGNQLLHIVNAANQKNANAGQLLKRVNLLTNLANVQGSNEQKMVQFVCKSADGKSIQLPHQRSMVLRLQPLDPATVPTTPKQNDNQEHASSSGTSHSLSEKDSSPQEMKSRSLYEENYAKFVKSDTKFAQNGDQKSSQEKATSLPKFNQVFGKQVYQDKQDELETDNMPQNPGPPEENNPPLEQMNDMTNPQMLIRKPNQTQPTHVQPNLVQQIKQTIGPMNIQTMHGGVIYTRQIPVNIGNGQTINLITVPSTELVDDSGQKQQADGKFNQEGDPPIIKIVPTNQATSANGSGDDNSQLKTNNEGGSQPNPQPQPQPVLTQMRIKLPMLSKAPQMVGGTRVVRPSFFQIQRNVIGGANQQVYQQLVLTAAPPIGQSIRLPAQVQKLNRTETQSSPESQMSSSTLEQLREFDMVLEQVKERSTVQPGSSTATNNFSKLKGSPDTTDAPTPSTSTQESPTQVLYSVGNSQTLNMVNYVTRKSTITSTTTTSFVRSPDSTGTVESPSSSTHSHLPHTVTSDSCASSCASEAAASTASQPKPKKKKPKPSTSNSNPFNIKNTPKPSSQKPLEDEQTTQRILYILAEYKEQVENSPDKDKPAPRRRNNPAAPNAGSSKRKKSSSGSRRRDMSPVLGEDSCRTMGSEDSSCGTSLGECNECLETHSPEESPTKVVRRLTFEQETQITQTRTTTTTTTVPQRNVIVTDGQAFAVRGATGKPATTVLMPANYLLPVSMVKGGQQIAIVTNRGPKLLVGAGEGGTGGTLLFQRLIGPGGLKPMIARPGVRHIRLPTAALHNLQTFNIAAPASTVPPPDSTASPAPAPAPPDLVDTRAMSSPWPDRDAGEVKPERGNSSPEGSEPWNLPSSSIADDYGYEEIVRTDNMDRTVLDAIPDRFSPDLEAQRIFDKMFDNDSKKSMYDSRCSYDIDASDDDKNYHQVVHRKDGRHTRLTHVSAAALRHKYAILEHELRLQKSLSEECEDLGVDSPSASELFPEAELLFAPSPAHEQTIDHCHTPQPTIQTQGIPQPDLDDQIATDQLLTHKERPDDLDINLDDVGEIVTVGEDGMTTIPLDHEEFARSHEEFARSHPNTTFHSEPEDGEVPPFTIAQGAKGRQITFHSRSVPGTVVMAPQTTVISQATVEAAGTHSAVKFTDIDNMINAMPSSQQANLNMPSVLVKDGNETMTKFDRLLNESREMSPNMTSNPASAIVHTTGNGIQVIRRVQYENRRDSRFLGEDSDAMIGGEKLTEECRDLPLDENSSERHPELFWDQSRAERKRFDFSSDSEKCCKSPYDETNSDSSGVGAHTRLDSVIKAARPERRRSDGSSAEESHPPLRTYPAKRTHQHAHHSHHHADVDRSLTGKTRATDRCHDVKDESRRRASNRGVVKRGCHCCNGSSVAPKPKKSRPKKSSEYPHN